MILDGRQGSFTGALDDARRSAARRAGKGGTADRTVRRKSFDYALLESGHGPLISCELSLADILLPGQRLTRSTQQRKGRCHRPGSCCLPHYYWRALRPPISRELSA